MASFYGWLAATLEGGVVARLLREHVQRQSLALQNFLDQLAYHMDDPDYVQALWRGVMQMALTLEVLEQVARGTPFAQIQTVPGEIAEFGDWPKVRREEPEECPWEAFGWTKEQWETPLQGLYEAYPKKTPMTTRAFNCLKQLPAKTVGDLYLVCQGGLDRLATKRGFGPKILAEIRVVLMAAGLPLPHRP